MGAHENLSPSEFHETFASRAKREMDFEDSFDYASVPIGEESDFPTNVAYRIRQTGNEIDPDQLEGMRASLESEGQRDPVEWAATPFPHLVEGHHRTAAAKEIGWESLRAKRVW